MEIKTYTINDIKIAEIVATDLVIERAEDGADLVGNIYYQGFDRVFIQEHHIAQEFFDLKNGMAGEILQKFSNYRVRLAIVGDFSKYKRQSLQGFIHESNKGKQVNFVSTVTEAISKLAQ